LIASFRFNLGSSPITLLACTYFHPVKIGAHRPVTVGKQIRKKISTPPDAEVHLDVVNGEMARKKSHRKSGLPNWRSLCKDQFAILNYSSVDKFIADIRGR
jgi:hypothetical protein